MKREREVFLPVFLLNTSYWASSIQVLNFLLMHIWIMGRDCEDVLKAAIEVGDSAGQIWNLKTKWGQTLEVFLFASKRTDAVGVVHGAMCVIIPLTVPGTQLECGNLPLENAEDLDSEGITTFSPHLTYFLQMPS
jgi:hypothetical protein